IQAYLGDRTPYARRGLVIAFSEVSWSGAALVGLPLAGLLMARLDWRAPFGPLAVLGLAGGAALWFVIPPALPQAAPALPQAAPATPRAIWRNPVVLAGLSLGLLIALGNELVAVGYGAWLEQAFNLNVVALGFSATVIGLAELAGEGLV